MGRNQRSKKPRWATDVFVVIDKARLGPLIAVTRDDRKPLSRAADGPYFRMEASGDSLRLTGREVEVTVPATVHEPGVLFLRVTLFRRMLGALPERGFLSIQVNGDGLVFGDTQLSRNALEALLYPDPATAPERHPAERGGEPGTGHSETFFGD